MNYVTGEPSFKELWDEELSDSQRRRSLQDWGDFKRWVKAFQNRGVVPSSFEIDYKLRDFMDGLRKIHGIRNAFLVTYFMATRVDPLGSTEQCDKILIRLIDTMTVLSLFKECRFYKNHLDTEGYGGPPRTLWESDRGLDSGKARYNFALHELKVRRLIK